MYPDETHAVGERDKRDKGYCDGFPEMMRVEMPKTLPPDEVAAWSAARRAGGKGTRPGRGSSG